MQAPIELTLYNERDEPVKTYGRSIVPWGLMKKAMSLMEALDSIDAQPVAQPNGPLARFASWFTRTRQPKNANELSIAMLEAFMVEFYGGQFKAADLKNADTAEMMSVLNSIMARAKSAMPINPTPPRKRHPGKK